MSLPWRVVDWKMERTVASFSSSQACTALTVFRESHSRMGARVMPARSTSVSMPPHALMACQAAHKELG